MKMNRFLMLAMGVLLLGLVTSCSKGGGKATSREQVQNFSVIDVTPNYEADQVQYEVKVFFTQPVEEEEALKIFDPEFVKQYEVTPSYLGNRRYNFEINNLKRGRTDTTVEMVLDGKPLKSKSKASRDLLVCSKDTFKAIDIKVDKENSTATLIFSQPLKQRNIDGFVSVTPEMGYRTEIVGNKIVFYLDKSNLYHYQLDDVQISVGSGIKDADGNSLRQEQTFKIDLTDILPKVKWTENGVIVPEVGDATIYFDAICLNSVVLRIVRVFDDNILVYYQDNDLDDSYNIRKVGPTVNTLRGNTTSMPRRLFMRAPRTVT